MSLIIKGKKDGQTIGVVTPETAQWQYVGFQAYRLAAGEVWTMTGDSQQEYCLTLLAGRADITVNGETFTNLGERSSVFEEKSPYAVYYPPNSTLTITALSDIEFAVSHAPATGKYPHRLIRPESMKRSVRGSGSNTRYICDILPESEIAESLLVVEVLTPAGNSSSYPPHKHDQSTDNETLLEETYYHRVNPPQGFAFQRVYTDDRSLDEAVVIEDNDIVLVPKGYHPCATVHGYDLYYLNTMAGPERRWQFHNDPDHEWLFQKG